MNADVVIAGGGIYGLGVARLLAARDLSVIVLEANRIGHGASAGLGHRGLRAMGRDPR